MTAYGRFRKAQRMGNPYEWWGGSQTGTTGGLAACEAATGDSRTETGGQRWSLRGIGHTKRGHPRTRQHKRQVR
jgi:hypothetical protein